MRRIPVAIVTGFLGSGKTTLLNRFLSRSNDQKTLVVVNEFGDVGLDNQLIVQSDDDVILLANGCLCCAVKGDLVNKMREMCFRPEGEYERVIIETSGLADPSSVAVIFETDPVISKRFGILSVLATVDGVCAVQTLEKHPESVRQIALADKIVLTKLDLAPQADGRLVALLESINPYASFVDGHEVDLLEPSQRTALDRKIAAEPQHSRDVGAFAIYREEPMSLETLDLAMRMLSDNFGSNLLRVKGLVLTRENPGQPAAIHAAQGLVHSLEWLEAWPDEDKRSRLVFVTQRIDRAEIEEVLNWAEKMTAKARQVAQVC